MTQLLVFVLDNPELCPEVLEAWEQAGVTGITILESTGMARLRQRLRDDVPLMPSLRNILASSEEHHRTLFSVIDDEAALERAIAATQQIVGDLHEPYSGFLFVVPVTRAIGLRSSAAAQPHHKKGKSP